MDKEYRIIGSGNGLREKLDEKEFIHSFKDGEYNQRWGNRRIKLSVFAITSQYVMKSSKNK
jgi:hypothetical protein